LGQLRVKQLERHRPIEPAIAQTTVPMANPTSEITRSRFLPYVSPSLPTSGVSTAELRRKPVKTQVTQVVEV